MRKGNGMSLRPSKGNATAGTFRAAILLVVGVLVGASAALASALAQNADPAPNTDAVPKRVLIYSDSNAWGWVPTESGFPTVRLSDDERFGGVLERELGDGYEVVVDGLNNRTTDLDDFQDWGNVPARAFNGAAELPEAIARELPLDLVVVMLGTNDAKAQFERSADEIAEAAVGLGKVVANSTGVATEYAAPKVLVVAPPPIGTMNHEGIAQFYAGGDAKSATFKDAFEAAGKAAGVPVFSADDAMGTSDGFDGVHFSTEDHRQLGAALAPVVRELIE